MANQQPAYRAFTVIKREGQDRWPAAAYRSAASSTDSRKLCSSVDASGRGCSLMFGWYHRLVPRLASYQQVGPCGR
jgi:hypothetical protein